MQEDGCDKGVHQLYLGTERNAPFIPNWFQPCQCRCCLCFPGEILGSICGLEPSSDITELRYLKLVTVSSSFCPFTFISVLMSLVLFVISLVFSALISMLYAVETLSRYSTNFASSSSSPAKPSMLSAKRRLVIVLPPMLTVPF